VHLVGYFHSCITMHGFMTHQERQLYSTLDDERNPKKGDYFTGGVVMITQNRIIKITCYKQNIPDVTCWSFETPNKITEDKIFQN